VLSFKSFINILKSAGKSFGADNAIKLSASLSYYTVFALGPMLMIMISLAGLFLGEDAVKGKIYAQLKTLVGSSAALQIQEIIKNIEASQFTSAGVVIGGMLLVLGATGVFTEIQDSINYIWSIRAKPKKNWLRYLTNRLISFSLVVGLGFLLLVSLLINTVIDAFSDYLTRFFSDDTYYIAGFINTVLTLGIITGLFSIIYKVLPDAKIAWRDALVGSGFTATLFILGKFLIGLYMAHSKVGLTYGAAASIIIILTWIYYSSIILYFGAEFTKVYALTRGQGIKPYDTAVFIVKTETKEIKPMTEAS